MNVILGLIVDPVEAGLHGQLGQKAVLLGFPVISGYIHCPAFVVKRALRVVTIFIPGLCHTQVNPRPLVHHCNGQPVQAVLTSLEQKEQQTAWVWHSEAQICGLVPRAVHRLQNTIKRSVERPQLNIFVIWKVELLLRFTLPMNAAGDILARRDYGF